MQGTERWRTATLVTAALLVGSVIGPPLAHAAAAGLVRIEGGHNANLAAVSRSGKLSVNAGLPMTPSGQVKFALASPADSVVQIGFPNCAAGGGIYIIPKGKALIITGATFDLHASSPGISHRLLFAAGPHNNPCAIELASAEAPSSEDQVSQNQVFSPGIPVPAGDSIGLYSYPANADDGDVCIYGYLVPAAAVPHSILRNMPPPGGHPAIKPRQ